MQTSELVLGIVFLQSMAQILSVTAASLASNLE